MGDDLGSAKALSQRALEAYARTFCRLADVTYLGATRELDGSVTIRLDASSKPRPTAYAPKPKPWQSDDDEDSGF